ncbi:MAG: hypothetical protein HOC91_14115 [Nitrospinaceae bacterium]|nr:hypothetical protein [Nitrospinaceae bacterium]MBT3435826.1 hypothetical protein [Nitrospinaceae bacterium]MBT3822408.1 hypothetical protein [Nitrospinaceae bacterium]MBT4094121.1 hypothetical protein [Nitrospinaceae bacterium]MBT4431640.1 hypothetical protein [Nitrospinaceae bacterium]
MKKYSIFALLFTLMLMPVVALAAPKGDLKIALPADPTTMDPHTRTGAPMSNTWPLVFDTLLYRNAAGEFEPNLATSYKWVKPTVLELKIRKGVKFHNGEVLDAHAVKYSLERMFKPELKSRVKNFWKSVKTIEAVDDYTVRINTKHPDSFLFSPMSGYGHIVPPKYYESHDLKFLARNPVGSGPYRLTKWRKGSEMIFEAFPGYWNPSKQKFKRGLVSIVPEPTTRVSALLAGTVDIVKDVPPQMAAMVNANPKLETAVGHGPKACFIIMVLKGDVPWTNVKVRQAVNYAIDKKSIVKNVLQGYGSVAAGTIVGPSSFGHNPKVKAYSYNLAKAKKLMAEAGYAKGFSVPLMVPIGRYLKGVQGAEAVAGYLKKIGVKVKVTPLEYGAWRRNSRSKWKKGYPPYWNYACRNDSALHSAWMFGGALYGKSTHGGIRDKKLDAAIDGARATENLQEQIKKYQDINRQVHSRAILGFLYHLDEVIAKKKTLNYKVRTDGYLIFSEASWK